MPSSAPYVSVVVPVFNEEANLVPLHARIASALASVPGGWELILVDDGSRDRSVEVLRRLQAQDPDHVRVVELLRNFGQHAAVFAGMSVVRGQAVVTLDADLQNPPEEIPRLLETLEKGYDVVGGYRREREDTVFRRAASRIVNRLTARATGMRMRDYGCMLRAYKRPIVDAMTATQEISTFIPVLANALARDIAEIEVAHAPRAHGASKYSLRRLLKLNFDLMTGFSTLPLQFISWIGALLALVGLGFGVFLFVRRLIVGPEVEGVFTLFAILFALTGAQLFCLGLLGEYIGRIYSEVRRRPRFIVRRLIEGHANASAPGPSAMAAARSADTATPVGQGPADGSRTGRFA
jgi:undecaprenyl-phosphate 4-deoxy-4-formamido-L-arabinose transferase